MPEQERKINQIIQNPKIVYGAFGNSSECVGIVERIDEPETGGIFTKYVGCEYLFKGYPDVRMVDGIDVPKRMIIGGASLFHYKVVRFVFAFTFLAFLVLPKRLKKQFLTVLFDKLFLEVSWLPMRKVILPKEKYCVMVKEVDRALSIVFGDTSLCSEPIKRIKKESKDIILMCLEYDYTYRARWQDAIPLIDKEKLKKNPRKEISRIFDILVEREAQEDKNVYMSKKWKDIKRIVSFGMRIKETKGVVVRFFLELDLEKIRFDEADWYFVLDRSDYNYGGFIHKERMEQKIDMDKKMGNKKTHITFQEK